MVCSFDTYCDTLLHLPLIPSQVLGIRLEDRACEIHTVAATQLLSQIRGYCLDDMFFPGGEVCIRSWYTPILQSVFLKC